jgi:hypothetical protein
VGGDGGLSQESAVTGIGTGLLISNKINYLLEFTGRMSIGHRFGKFGGQ